MTHFIFQPRARRAKRFERYNGKPATILFNHANGQHLISCDGQRFSAYPDELTALAKPMHGSPSNWTFDNDGSLRSRTVHDNEAK